MALAQMQARGMNDQIFRGVMTRLDIASDKPPEGSRGKRVVIPRAVAAGTLAQLRGHAGECGCQFVRA